MVSSRLVFFLLLLFSSFFILNFKTRPPEPDLELTMLDDLELMILLALPDECWGDKCTVPPDFVQCFLICIYFMGGACCHGISMAVRRQLAGAGSLLPCGSWEMNSGHQAWCWCLYPLSHLASSVTMLRVISFLPSRILGIKSRS